MVGWAKARFARRAHHWQPTAWARRGAVKLAQTVETCLRARLCPPLYGDCQEGTPVGQQAPRAARADRGGGSRAHERHALSSDSFFVRPGAVSSSRPASFSEAPRAAAVKAGRRWVVTTSCVVARPRLDGSEHGARVARSGAKGRAVSSPTSLVLDWAVINMRKAPHNLVSGRA